MAEKSTHYNLDILKGNDIFNPNTVFDNFEKIDTDMYNIDTNAVHSAVHILSGSVNALTRTNPEYNIFKFVSTAPYTANQTFTVDGKQVSAYTTNGQPLDTNCYVIGATVLCALNGSILTLFVRSSGTAQNSLKLNGHPDTYFAVKGDTSKTLKDVDDIAVRASNIAQTTMNKIGGVILWENNEISSSFTTKKINIDFMQYKMLMILFEREAGYPNDLISTTTFGNSRYYTLSINNGYMYMRSFLILSDGILFDNSLELRSFGSYVINNNNLIPYKVIGILK